MPLGNAGRTWYDESRGPWMVVSFMYVLEVTTGATMRLGFYRMLGTFVGAVVGYVVSGTSDPADISASSSPTSTRTAS